MNKKLINFQADVELMENIIKTFEPLNCSKVDFTRFQHSLNALKEIDRETFDMFRLTVATLYNMTHQSTKSDAIERKHIPHTDTIDPESVKRAQDAFNEVYESVINNAAEPEEMCSDTNEMDATKEVEKPTPVYTPEPDEKVYPYNMPDTAKNKFETIYYLPETGKFMGEYSGELKPYTYHSGSICVNVAVFNSMWKPCKSKIVFVKNILRENGALPLPKSTYDKKKRVILTFKNGIRFDFRLSNLAWAHGLGRTAESRDEEYLKRIIKDALSKLGENASSGAVFNFLNKEREVISVHMCDKLLPIVRLEVHTETEERKEAISKLSEKPDSDGEDDLLKYVADWKKMFKHYPSKSNIEDIKKYLAEKGYLKPDFSPMAIKETIKLITGVSLSLKDVM
jgi:hypothetical protein